MLQATGVMSVAMDGVVTGHPERGWDGWRSKDQETVSFDSADFFFYPFCACKTTSPAPTCQFIYAGLLLMIVETRLRITFN